MKALNGMTVAISGLLSTGATALTAVAVIPASAQAAVSAPHVIVANDDGEANHDVSQTNACGSSETMSRPFVITCSNESRMTKTRRP